MLLDAIEMMFFGRSEAPPGQVIITPTGTSSMTWQVPQGVSEISVVMVGVSYGSGNQPITSLSRGATVLLSVTSPLTGGVGGGNGGAYGGSGSGGGGGGAGGYSGPGGDGGETSTYDGMPGKNGTGGGGGGGKGPAITGTAVQKYGGRGGGVGLLGQGNDGIRGVAGSTTADADGKSGSIPATGRVYGGGLGSNTGQAERGGNLRWRNAIPVTPGETLSISFAIATLPAEPFGTAIRIIWGGGRSFPLNAGDM